MNPRAGWQYDSPAVLHSDLDDAGLTVQQFRVMLHVCRRYGDGSNGIGCTSKVDTMAEVCRLHPDSVRKILKSLVSLRWLHRIERSGATTVYVPRFPTPSISKGGVEDQGRGVEPMEGLNLNGGGASGLEGGEGLRIKGDEGIQIREPNKGTPKKPRKISAMSRCSEAEAIAFCLEIGLTRDDGSASYHRWNANGWTISGKPIKDWKAQVRQWKVSGWHPSQKSFPNGGTLRPPGSVGVVAAGGRVFK